MKRSVVGVVLVALGHAERIGFLGEVDRVLLAIGEAAHDDARQPVLAFQPHEVILEASDVEDQPAGLVRHEIAPILAAGAAKRRFHDLVVLRAVARW